MSLAARLEEAQASAKPKWEQWLKSLPADDLKALQGAAGNNGLSTKKMLEIIRAEGGSVGEPALKDWRRGYGFTGR
jgi:hypothetical protein